jgi:hypothetical protein
MKPRHQLYLDDIVTAQLEELAAAPGASKSAIVADALRLYFRHRGGTEQEAAIRLRLDRLSRHNDRLSRQVDVLTESLTIFVKYYLIQTAHLPDSDGAAAAKGAERFASYIAAVGRNVAKGDALVVQKEGDE